MSTRQILRDFLGEHIGASDLRDDEDLYEAGHVSSLFAIVLVGFVERQFEVAVEDADLEIDNFRSIDALTRLVESKRARSSGSGSA